MRNQKGRPGASAVFGCTWIVGTVRTAVVGWLIVIAGSTALGQPVLQRDVSGAGGGMMTSAGARMVATVGQPIIGVATSGDTRAHLGFWLPHVNQAILSVDNGLEASSLSALTVAPNPARGPVTVRGAVAGPGRLTLVVQDMLGREVATLHDDWRPAGPFAVAADLSGLPAGRYVVSLIAGNERVIRALHVLR